MSRKQQGERAAEGAAKKKKISKDLTKND